MDGQQDGEDEKSILRHQIRKAQELWYELPLHVAT